MKKLIVDDYLNTELANYFNLNNIIYIDKDKFLATFIELRDNLLYHKYNVDFYLDTCYKDITGNVTVKVLLDFGGAEHNMTFIYNNTLVNNIHGWHFMNMDILDALTTERLYLYLFESLLLKYNELLERVNN